MVLLEVEWNLGVWKKRRPGSHKLAQTSVGKQSSKPDDTCIHPVPWQLSVFVFCSSMENGRPPDPADWAVMDVVNYFRTAGFEEQASAFQEQVTAWRSMWWTQLPSSPQWAEESEEEEDQRAERGKGGSEKLLRRRMGVAGSWFLPTRVNSGPEAQSQL
jgi:hypothetical protein